MCRYAEKRREGDDLKTYCLAHVGEPFPISDTFNDNPYRQLQCEGKKFYRCGDFWVEVLTETTVGKALSSVALGLIVYYFGFRSAIPEEESVFLWISLVGSIATFFTIFQNQAIGKYLKKIIQSKEQV